jgi:hypothetical protein
MRLGLFLLLGLCATAPFSASGQVRRSSPAAKAVVRDRLVFPTRCRIPETWVRYDLDGGYVYAGPSVANQISFQNGSRRHFFRDGDLFYALRLNFGGDLTEPGYTDDARKEYVRLAESDGGQVLGFRRIALNIVEFDEIVWGAVPGNTGGRRRVYSKTRLLIIGKARVMFSLMSGRPLGASGENALRTFADTFAISDSLAQTLSDYYTERDYAVEVSPRPIRVPSGTTRF